MRDQPFKLEESEKGWVNELIVKPLQRLTLAELRQRARNKGINCDGRWRSKTLRDKIIAVDVEFYRRTDIG